MAQTQLAYQAEEISFNTRLTNSLESKIYKAVSDYLGENEFTVSGAIPVLLPALCSFLDSNEPQSRDLGKISALITNYRESLGNFNLNNIEPNSFSTLTDIGTDDLMELFGTKLSALLDNISQVSGLKEESAFTLLALLTPYLLKQVGTHLPKGSAFAPGLLTLIDENKEIFQDLIRDAKPKLAITKKEKKESTNLFPYFIIITLSAFFIFNGLNYVSTSPDNYKVILKKTVSSIIGFEQGIRSKLGLMKAPVGAKANPSESSNSLPNLTENTTKEGPVNQDLTGPKLELRFDPGTLKNSNPEPVVKDSLSKEVEAFIFNTQGVRLRTFNLDKVKFGFGISSLTEEGKDQLIEVVSALKRVEDLHIEIAGHTDNTGEEETNKKISKERAEAVASVFVQNGIAPLNIHTLGYGSSRPIATNSTLEGRYLNRRIELLLAKKK